MLFKVRLESTIKNQNIIIYISVTAISSASFEHEKLHDFLYFLYIFTARFIHKNNHQK